MSATFDEPVSRRDEQLRAAYDTLPGRFEPSEASASGGVCCEINQVRDAGGHACRVKNVADARVDKKRGVVVCSTPNPKHYEFGFPEGVYHTFDYPFYFFNVRANAAQRIETYLAGSAGK